MGNNDVRCFTHSDQDLATLDLQSDDGLVVVTDRTTLSTVLILSRKTLEIRTSSLVSSCLTR